MADCCIIGKTLLRRGRLRNPGVTTMADKTKDIAPTKLINLERRRILKASGSAAVVSALGGPQVLRADSTKTLRWGFVGTGRIANSMVGAVTLAPGAELVAVSSRRMETANAFANQHAISLAFDSWETMFESDAIDAVYIATPTSVREEISVTAARKGKHVLGEKPFASLPSLQNIIAACRENNVGFMDGTHFVHHPRTHRIKNQMADDIGWVWSVASAFQFNLTNKSNIRYNSELEPMGAIGDAGWYNMRAAIEYLSPDSELEADSTYKGPLCQERNHRSELKPGR
jgi:predicted dehydrogenase